ncbi:MAG TPA: hypothetical protein VFS43_34195 [Polyangiaceae bacterium]|nr:hypothetical protein [Polyangiaceae bacterium]
MASFPPSAGVAPNVDCYKGVAVRELVDWCVASFSEARVHEAIAGLGGAQWRGFDLGREGYGVLPGGWYPATAVNGLLDALLVGVPAAEQARLAKGAAEATAGKTLRGIYGKLLRLLCTPALYAKHSQRVWDSYHNTGRLIVRLEGPRALTTVTDWQGHHPFVCRMNAEAAKIIYTTLGQRGVSTVRMKCVSERAEACVFLTTWTP